jgi:hypothetical protein
VKVSKDEKAEPEKPAMVKNAANLNAHLAAGGTVYVSTMTRITKYTKRNAGLFEDGSDGLYVRHGKSRLFLGHPDRPMVGITRR